MNEAAMLSMMLKANRIDERTVVEYGVDDEVMQILKNIEYYLSVIAHNCDHSIAVKPREYTEEERLEASQRAWDEIMNEYGGDDERRTF